MPQAKGLFSPIDSGESYVFGYDFANDLASGDTILTVQSCTLEQVGGQGLDPTPAARLLGLPVIAGTVVSQRINFPIGNVVYKFTVFITTTLGDTLDLWAFVTCVP